MRFLRGNSITSPCPALQRFHRLLAFLVAALFGGISAAHADLLYNNGAPQYQPRTDGFEMTGWFEADDFILTATARIESIEFGTIERSGNFSGMVVWQIYSNSAQNTPGTVLHSGSANVTHTPTGYVNGSEIEYYNSFAIQPIVLAPGVYWLALHNGPTSLFTNQRVYWQAAASAGLRESSCDPGPQFLNLWLSNFAPNGISTELVFRVNGAVAPRVTGVSYANATAKPQISFTTSSGRSYRLEYRNNVSEAWQTLSGFEYIAGDGEIHQVTDSSANASVPRRFYRVVMY